MSWGIPATGPAEPMLQHSPFGRSLVLAMQLLTRLPTPVIDQPTADDYGRSVLAYPLIGLLIGLLLAAGLGLLQLLAGNHAVLLQAALLLALWVGLSGALHLDGLADSVDAWIGGHGDRERTLAIMKDPASGPMAVAALVILLLIKFAALAALIGEVAWPLLLLPPLLGRAALVAAFLFIPYARGQGLGSAQASRMPRAAALLMLAFSILTAPLLAGWAGLLAVLTSTAIFIAVRRATLQRLGGFTGDIAGTLCELTEAAVLVALALLAGTAAMSVA